MAETEHLLTAFVEGTTIRFKLVNAKLFKSSSLMTRNAAKYGH